MGIVKAFSFWVFIFVAGAAMFALPLEQVHAANVTVSQKILPVRFVYLGKDGSIERIWSNVEDKDDGYAVKFFDKDQKEIIQNSSLIQDYQHLISEKKDFSGKLDKSVHFNKKGSSWEEIDTVV